MSITINGVVLLRRDTEANWTYVNPVIADGEAALSTDKKDFKVGPGNWDDLDYWISSPGSNVVQIPFTTTDIAPTLTINWQTDIPAGYSSTYAALLGNYFPKPLAYVLSSGTTYINQGTVPTVTYDGTLINTVVFDFGGASSGFIRW